MLTLFGNKKNSTQPPSNDLPSEIKTFIQSLNNEKDRELCTVIYTKVTKEKHAYDRPQKGDRTLKRCVELFKQEANPNVLTKLEVLLREQIELEKSPKKEEYQKYYRYYIEKFLPALLDEIIGLSALHKNQDKNKEKLQKIGEVISKTISGSNNQIDLRSSQINEQDNAGTLPPSDSPGSRADLPVLNKKSPPPSPVSSRSNNQNKYGQGDDEILNNLNIPKEIREKYSKVMEEMMEKINRRTKISALGNSLGSREENKNQMQPEQATKDTPPERQSNNKNFHIVLVTGCILLAVGCLVAGIITAGAVLFAMASAFAAAAVATWYLTYPSSELTSTNLSSPGVDGKERKN